MEQLLTHIFADYFTQSDWMAMNKSKRVVPCLVHVLLYTSVFLFLTFSWKALLVIGVTHFILDHWPNLLRRAIWFKNHLNPRGVYAPYNKCNATGYYDNIQNELHKQPYENECYVEHMCFKNKEGLVYKDDILYPRLNYITVWLYIITDNFLHLFINYMALRYL